MQDINNLVNSLDTIQTLKRKRHGRKILLPIYNKSYQGFHAIPTLSFPVMCSNLLFMVTFVLFSLLYKHTRVSEVFEGL
jgi:hypothetical protein